MKRIIGGLFIIPFAVSGCRTDYNFIDPFLEEDYVITSQATYTDGISDAWIKDYKEGEFVVLNNLHSSTFFLANYSTREKYDNYATASDFNDACLASIRNNNFERVKVDSVGDEIIDSGYQRNSWKTFTSTISNITEYEYEEVNGTAWLIDQTETHYIIATNHHVVYNKGVRYSDCIVIGNDSNNDLDIGIVDTSVGDRGIIMRGRDESLQGTMYENTDIALLAVKKDNYKYEYNELKINRDIKKEDTNTWLKENNVYTYGYPYGIGRYNKSRHPRYNSLVTRHFNDEKNEGIEISGELWQYDHYSFDFFANGGSSGSPIVDANGELVFVNTVKQYSYSWSDKRYGRNPDNAWDKWRNSGFASYELIGAINNTICLENTYDLSICI